MHLTLLDPGGFVALLLAVLGQLTAPGVIAAPLWLLLLGLLG